MPTILTSLRQAGKTDADTLINTACNAGYDIEKLRHRLQPA